MNELKVHLSPYGKKSGGEFFWVQHIGQKGNVGRGIVNNILVTTRKYNFGDTIRYKMKKGYPEVIGRRVKRSTIPNVSKLFESPKNMRWKEVK
jgi:hypothetical protein